MSSEITRDDWLRALADAGVADVVSDPSAITAQEFADMFHLFRHTAEHRLKALERAGRATRTKKIGLDSAGHSVYLNAWKLVEPTTDDRRRSRPTRRTR